MNLAPLRRIFVALAAAIGLLCGLSSALPARAISPAEAGAHPRPGLLDPDASAGPEVQGRPWPSTGQIGPSLLSDPARARLDPESERPDPAALQAWVDAVIADAPAQTDPFELVDACMAQDMQGNPDSPDDNTPGASLAISVGGEIVYQKGYGVKHADAGGEIDAETVFRIGSTTKQLTAAALMQRVEAGQVDLQAPITTYLPDVRLAPPYDMATITSEHLLTHSTGIPDQYWVVNHTLGLQDWLPYLQLSALHAPPGRFWNYANPNFSLAGAIVERLGGQPYPDYMAEQIFARAAMTHTTFYPALVEAGGNFATGHDGAQRLGPEAFDWPAIGPAGTAFSTPSDMLRWANLLMDGGGAVLSPASAAAMQAPHVPLDIRPWEHYGYGIFVTDFRDVADPEQIVTVYDHGGNVYGFSSQLFWVPERDFAVSILANTIRSLSGAAYCTLQAVAGVQPRSSADLVTGPEDWAAFEGTYAMMNTAMWPFTGRVHLDGETLRLDYSDIGRSPIVGRDYAMWPALADTFLLDSDEDGQPETTLVFTFMRDRATGERIEYLRDRLLVGHRVGQFPERVVLEGSGCAEIAITAERDMPELQVTASGLSTWSAESGLPLGQDDPADPTSASFKRDITVAGGADLFWLGIAAKPGDSIASYLMLDANGDDRFDFPGEVAVAGNAVQTNLQLLYATRPLPAGHYQLWVQGLEVADPEAGFDILPLTAMGDRLRLEAAPTALADGASHTLRVCADDVTGLETPALGSVTFRYGLPPRLVRVMVDWSPAAAPTLYLPLLSRLATPDASAAMRTGR